MSIQNRFITIDINDIVEPEAYREEYRVYTRNNQGFYFTNRIERLNNGGIIRNHMLSNFFEQSLRGRMNFARLNSNNIGDLNNEILSQNLQNPNNMSKYKFYSDSKEFCEICFENFKFTDIMCINSCYHYWCGNCNDKFKKNYCPFCRSSLEPNLFFDSKGESGYFKNIPHCIKLIEIIKQDIEISDSLENKYDIIDIDNFVDNKMNELD
jgi:hypothetical protein